MGDGSAFRINKQYFIDETRDNTTAATELAQCFNDQSDILQKHIKSIHQPNTRMKLLHTLYELSVRFSAQNISDLYELGLPLTHQDIAELIGSTRETVSLELKKLMEDKFISYNRSSFVIYNEKIAIELNQIPTP